MSAIGKYLSDTAAEKIRQAIDEAGGNEVFFIGYTEEDLIVHDVAVAARGHKTAVPVITQTSRASGSSPMQGRSGIRLTSSTTSPPR